jgi:hypothetical protein
MSITTEQQTLLCDRESLQEGKVTMKISNKEARKFPLMISKILMALVFISLIGVTVIEPAFGKNYKNRGYYDHGRRGYYHPGYRAPFYPPPPVYYEPYPYQSPGISLIFPIRIR